jgi:myo-inositol-hexaphosphate 3-phosphohydrolase
VTVTSTLETEPFFEEDEADADDPAIWVHPGDRAQSIVVGTLKSGGLAVFDLGGRLSSGSVTRTRMRGRTTSISSTASSWAD